METMLSSRTYTTKQVAPLLQQKNFKLQTEIREFRKTIDQMPKTLDPNAAKDIRGNEKRALSSAGSMSAKLDNSSSSR